MSDDIHSCSYDCEYPACIKRQRDALRDQLFIDRDVYGDGNVYRGERSKDSSVKTVWVGLKDEEIHALDDEMRLDAYALCRAVEAKLKEKNSG
jgi:hypothetical protein